MKKLITFAGTGKYQEATYGWNGQTKKTCFIAEALNTWLAPDEVLTVLTPTAEGNENWKTLQSLLPHAKPLRIPEPGSESALWDIFKALSQAITPGDEVVLDITHGFRALPIIALASAGYLQSLSGVTITHILYGAWEAKANDVTPVFDIGIFLQLQQWTQAAVAMRTTGDPRPFGSLLSGIQEDAWLRKTENTDQSGLPTKLKTTGADLRKLGNALSLTRVDEVAETLPRILQQLDKAKGQLETWAPPFAHALDAVKSTFEPFQSNSQPSQLQLAQWYVDKGQSLQAVTFAREWLVSHTMELMDQTIHPRDKIAREEFETLLNHAVLVRSGSLQGLPSPRLSEFQASPQEPALANLWGQLRDLRNDIAHCGMRKNALPAETALKNIAQVIADLGKL